MTLCGDIFNYFETLSVVCLVLQWFAGKKKDSRCSNVDLPLRMFTPPGSKCLNVFAYDLCSCFASFENANLC